MLAVTATQGDTVYVLDTDDGVTQTIKRDELFALVRVCGVEVKRVVGNMILPANVNYDAMPLEDQIKMYQSKKVSIDIRKRVSLYQWFVTSVVAHVDSDGSVMQSHIFGIDDRTFKFIRFVINLRNIVTKNTATVDIRSMMDLELLVTTYNPYGLCKSLRNNYDYIVFEVNKACFEFLSVLDKLLVVVVDDSSPVLAGLQAQTKWYDVVSPDGTLFWWETRKSGGGITPLFYLACRLWSTCYLDSSLYIRLSKKLKRTADTNTPVDSKIVAYKVDFTDKRAAERLIGKALVTRMNIQKEYQNTW